MMTGSFLVDCQRVQEQPCHDEIDKKGASSRLGMLSGLSVTLVSDVRF